jgi:hypothetical protein
VENDNFKKWLSEPRIKEIEEILKNIDRLSTLDNYRSQIKAQLILLFLMREHGGVVIHYKFIFVENLEWLKTIHQYVIANKGNKNVKPQYFTFHLMDAGPRWNKQNREVDY